MASMKASMDALIATANAAVARAAPEKRKDGV
jgi:hypothetical protein